MNARRGVGELLADRIDYLVEPLAVEQLDAYRRVLSQRDEYHRRVYIAEAYLQDTPCRCRRDEKYPAAVLTCDRCYLLRVLVGDE